MASRTAKPQDFGYGRPVSLPSGFGYLKPRFTAEPYLSRMNRVYVLTKADLADPEVTYHWVKKFGTQGSPAFAVESNTGRG